MFERLSPPARTILIEAVQQASRQASDQLRATHLLIALCADAGLAGDTLRTAGISADALLPDSAVETTLTDREALLSIGIDLDEVRRRIEENFGPGALDGATPTAGRRRGPGRRRLRGGHVPFGDSAKSGIERALREAVQLGSGSIGPEHLLLGLLQQPDPEVSTALARAGASVDQLRHSLLEQLRRSA